MSDRGPARVALVGVGGYGQTHLLRLRQLHETGRARLVAVCDVSPPAGEAAAWLAAQAIPLVAELDHMLRNVAPDVVVIATPPHRHASMARAAIAAGADVLVEKPPVVTLSQLDELLEGAAQRLCQVGFQSLGSWAMPRLRRLIESGELGAVDLVSAGGCWIRGDRYYGRSPWAGRKTLDGWTVNDGALTNPYAHAVMNCLALAGVETTDGAMVAMDLYRAHDIEVHDTGSVKVVSPGLPTILVAVTLCATEVEEPWLTVRGELGTARWVYYGDSIQIRDRHGTRVEQGPRTVLLDNLLEVREGEVEELLAPLSRTRPFVELTELVRDQPVQLVPPEAVRRRERDGDRVVEIVGVEASTHRAAAEGLQYSEVDAAWTEGPGPRLKA